MKKKLFGAIALLASLACFAGVGCGKDNKPTTSDSGFSSITNADLSNAKNILKNMYFSDKYANSNEDYTLVKTLPINGVEYDVQWTLRGVDGATISENDVKLVDAGDTIKVDVNEASLEEIKYELVATITTADNTASETQVFPRTLKALPKYVIAPITAKPAENTAYKLHVYQSTNKQDLYFAGDMEGYFFKTTTEHSEGVDIYVEYVEGSETEFYPYFLNEKNEKKYIGVKINDSYNNIIFDANPVSKFIYNEQYNIITTEVNEKLFYLGNYGTLRTISASDASKFYGNAGNNYGSLVRSIDRTTVANEIKVENTKSTLSMYTSYVSGATVTLPARGSLYAEASISYASNSDKVVVNGNTFSVQNVTEATTATITATISCGDKSDTKEFTLNLVPNTTDAILASLENLGSDKLVGAQLTGKITSFYSTNNDNGEYNSKYENVSVNIDVNGKNIVCYRIKGNGADTIGVGDTITVSGTMELYKDTPQFVSGSTLVSYVKGEGGNEGGGNEGGNPGGEVTPPAPELTEAELVDKAYELEKEAKLECTLTGVIYSIDTPYSNQFHNVTVSIIVAGKFDKPIQCFRLKGEGVDKLKVGDTITVNGSIENYSGKIQFNAASLENTQSDASLSSAMKLFIESNALTTTTEVKEATSVVLPTAGALYTDIAIAWESNSEYAAIENGKVTYTLPKDATSIALTATLSLGGEQTSKTISVSLAANPVAGQETVTTNIGKYAEANSWANSTQHDSLKMNDVITVTVSPVESSKNTGKYYQSSGGSWRIYSSENATITFTAAKGTTIISIKLTYSEGEIKNAANNAATAVNAETITFEATKKTFITNIEVVYVAADTSETIADGVTKKDNTYFLSNANGLAWFNDQVNKEGNTFEGMTVELTADIDLGSKPWTPVGQTILTEFLGTFDGKNHMISNLFIDETQLTLPTDNVTIYNNYGIGFFGWLDGTVKNVTFDHATVKGHHNVAVIVGYLQTGSIENCHVTNSTVTNTHSDDNRCGDKAGMIVGLLNGTSSLKNSSATDCTVSGGRDAGQLVGAKYTTAAIENSTATNVEVSANEGCTGANIKNELCGREY